MCPAQSETEARRSFGTDVTHLQFQDGYRNPLRHQHVCNVALPFSLTLEATPSCPVQQPEQEACRVQLAQHITD